MKWELLVVWIAEVFLMHAIAAIKQKQTGTKLWTTMKFKRKANTETEGYRSVKIFNLLFTRQLCGMKSLLAWQGSFQSLPRPRWIVLEGGMISLKMITSFSKHDVTMDQEDDWKSSCWAGSWRALSASRTFCINCKVCPHFFSVKPDSAKRVRPNIGGAN